MTIDYTIMCGNLLTEQEPSTDGIARLVELTEEAIEAEWPEAYVTVRVARVSGYRSPYLTRVILDDHSDPTDVRERVNEVATGAWQTWSATLTDADVVGA